METGLRKKVLSSVSHAKLMRNAFSRDTSRSRSSMTAMSCAEMSDALESIFVDGWTDAPALRAVPEDRRDRLESALESLLASHDRTRAVVSGGASVVPLGGGERPGTSGGRDPVTPPRGSDGATGSGADAFANDAEAIPDAVLSEHFGFLQMLHRQLLNALAEFRPGQHAGAPEFSYADEADDVMGVTGPTDYDGDSATEREDSRRLGRESSDSGAETRSWRSRRRQNRRLVVPAAGLSRRALEDVANAAQWIGGVFEGASRVHRVALASRAVPDAWADGVPTNAKDSVGVHLYSDLDENTDAFDPERVADTEGFFGGRIAWRWTETGGYAGASATTTHDDELRDDDDDNDDAFAGASDGDNSDGSRRSGCSRANAEGVSRECRASDDEPDAKTAAQASRLLDRLERAEHAWAMKKQNQMVLDSLRTVRVDATAALTLGLIRSPATGRVKDITRRVANAVALGETVRARYPAAPLTSLSVSKIADVRADGGDVAVAALEAFARCLAAVATALEGRAHDVVAAHHRARDKAGGGHALGALATRRARRTPEDRSLVGELRRAARRAREWWAVAGRRLRAEVEAVTGVRVADVTSVACCAGAPEDDSRRLPSR